MRADFHMHTYYSRDCATSPEALVARALRMGLGCIAVTDHNTIRGGQAVARIAPFPVIVASEVKTTHGEITGLFLTEEVPRGLSPMETVERIKAQGGLVSIPHPYDSVRTSVLSADAMVEVLPHADIIEAFNARNVFRGADERARPPPPSTGSRSRPLATPSSVGAGVHVHGDAGVRRDAAGLPRRPPGGDAASIPAALVGTAPHARRDNLQQGCQPPAHKAPPAGVGAHRPFDKPFESLRTGSGRTGGRERMRSGRKEGR